MATSFNSVVLLVALLALTMMSTPTFSSVETTTATDGGSGESSRKTTPENKMKLRFKCPNMLKQKMAEKVIEHVNATEKVKTVLRDSAVFVDCVAGKFCKCFMLRVEPLVVSCFGVVGGYCMVRALKGRVSDCALACVNHMVNVNANNQRLGI